METKYLKRLIAEAHKQIDLVERPARITIFRLLNAAEDYLQLLELPPNKVDAVCACKNSTYKDFFGCLVCNDCNLPRIEQD